MAPDIDELDPQQLAGRCYELASLAKRGGFELGAHLLEMACLEFLKQASGDACVTRDNTG